MVKQIVEVRFIGDEDVFEHVYNLAEKKSKNKFAGKRSLSSKATIEEEDVLSDIEAGETPLPARHHSDSGGMSGRQMFNLKCTPTAKHGEN